MNSEIKLIIADDHNLIRTGIRKILEDETGFKVIAEADSGDKLIEQVQKHPHCELVITDLAMPGMSGLSAIKQLKEKNKNLKILILSMHKESEYVKHAMSLGVDGYVLKEDIHDQLTGAIKSIMKGEKSFSSRLTKYMLEQTTRPKADSVLYEILTKREREVFLLVAKGLTNKEIANHLDIGFRTVETHRSNLMHKMDFNNLQELITFAIENGFLDSQNNDV